MRVVLLSDHVVPERAPLQVVAGELVEVGEQNADWSAFVFVATPRGSGWVPRRHIDITGSKGIVRVDYDTTELACSRGEHVDVLHNDADSGWSWCRNSKGCEGWVPNRLLDEPIAHGSLHHVELWVMDLDAAESSLGWLLLSLGYHVNERWNTGASYQLGPTYIVLEASSAVSGTHDRMRAGLNHLAFHVRSASEVDALVSQSTAHDWRLMFADRHPHAAGKDRYVAYLENSAGFEVELVALDVTS